MTLLEDLGKRQDLDKYRSTHWEGSFEEYLEIAKIRHPRTAYQYLLDMIKSYPTEEYTKYRENLTHYTFFDDPITGDDKIFGLDKELMRLVDVFGSAAQKLGPDRRIILLHGPVGTAKSTIVRLLKKGLEQYSLTSEGAIYSFFWNIGGSIYPCPMHEDPLRLIPHDLRASVKDDVGSIEGDLCPHCQYYFDDLMDTYDGDFTQVINHIRVHRIQISEKKRIGIGTFQPRDEKNQDSTELTGDINYRKIAEYGSDSDPRAFNFDGELNIANRGLVEFIEILKLDVAFLYDLLTASQEHKIKPKKFAHTDIDEVILGHTNNPEYRRLASDDTMEALRDRTIRIDIPYTTVEKFEEEIYRRDYNPNTVSKHISPHTLEVAAMWAVLTRLDPPKNASLTLVQKMKLYNGQSLPEFTEDSVMEIRAESPDEAMSGISPRFIQDVLGNILTSSETKCADPFILLRGIRDELNTHSLLADEKTRGKYSDLLVPVRLEFEELAKADVQKAIVADPAAAARVVANYIDNVSAYVSKEKVRNPITHADEPPSERLMREIEEKIEVNEARKDDFRREIMNYIGAMAIKGKKFEWDSNPRLKIAVEQKLFDDQKDSIKISSLVSEAVDPETQEKIDIVKSRMIKDLGYCDVCATNTLNYVASIFARGENKR